MQQRFRASSFEFSFWLFRIENWIPFTSYLSSCMQQWFDGLFFTNFQNWGDGRFKVMAVNSMSLEEELVENVNSAVTYLWLSISSGKSTYVVCNFVKKYAFSFSAVVFMVLNSFNLTSWELSKPFVILCGLVNIGISTLASWGFILYIGIHEWQAINIGRWEQKHFPLFRNNI